MAKAALEITLIDKGGSASGSVPASAPSSGDSAGMGIPASAGPSATTTFKPHAPGSSVKGSKPIAADAWASSLASRAVSGVGAGSSAARMSGQAAAGLQRAGMAMGTAAGVTAGAVLAAVLSPLIVAGVTKAIVGNDVGMASSYNGQVAFAEAMSTVRQQMAEMRRANEIGPQLARYEELRSEAMTALYDLVTEIKSGLLDVLIPIIEFMRDIVKWAAEKFGWEMTKKEGDDLVDEIMKAFERAAKMAAPKEGITMRANRNPITAVV